MESILQDQLTHTMSIVEAVARGAMSKEAYAYDVDIRDTLLTPSATRTASITMHKSKTTTHWTDGWADFSLVTSLDRVEIGLDIDQISEPCQIRIGNLCINNYVELFTVMRTLYLVLVHHVITFSQQLSN